MLKDNYGRFSYEESIAYKNDFLDEPSSRSLGIQTERSALKYLFFQKFIFENRKYSTKDNH